MASEYVAGAFWGLLLASIVSVAFGMSVEASVFLSAAGIVFALMHGERRP